MRKGLLGMFLILLLFLPYGLSHASIAQSNYIKANKLFAEGKFSDAILLYRSLLSSPSRDVEPSILYTRIGDSYFRQEDYHNALDAYRSALKDQNRSQRPVTQYWIGFCCLMLGKDAEAVTEFMKIPENYPSSGMWVGTAYYWAGRASERMGKKEQAAEFYRKAAGTGKSAQERFALQKANAVKGSHGVNSK